MTDHPSKNEIRRAREDLGLSQAELARVMQLGGDGARTIRRYESGEREPSGPFVVALAALGTIDALDKAGMLDSLIDMDEAMLDAGDEPIARPAVEILRALLKGEGI